MRCRFFKTRVLLSTPYIYCLASLHQKWLSEIPTCNYPFKMYVNVKLGLIWDFKSNFRLGLWLETVQWSQIWNFCASKYRIMWFLFLKAAMLWVSNCQKVPGRICSAIFPTSLHLLCCNGNGLYSPRLKGMTLALEIEIYWARKF